MVAFFISIFFLNLSAQASEVQSQTTVGTGLVSEELSYNGDAKSADPKKKGGMTWDLSYIYTTLALGATASSSPAPAASSAASDHSSAFTGGLGYSDKIDTGIDLNYSKTPEEGLSDIGPSLRLGYTFDLGQPNVKKKPKLVKKLVPKNNHQKTGEEDQEDVEDEPFMPTFKALATVGLLEYKQDVSTVVRAGSRRKAPAKAASIGIVQRQAEADFTLSSVEWLDIDLALTKYFYNRDVGTFLANLDDQRAIASGAANLDSTLKGFSSNEVKLDLTFHLPIDIDVNPEVSRSTSATDGSKTNSIKIDVSKLWADTWKTGIAYERDESATDLQNSGIATLSYEF